MNIHEMMPEMHFFFQTLITQISVMIRSACPSLCNGAPRLSSRVSNIESDDSQNVGLEDYNNISDGIFPHFTTPSIKLGLG